MSQPNQASSSDQTDQCTAPPSPPLVRLAASGTEGDSGAPAATARIQLSIGGQPVRFEITVPAKPVPLAALLPVFQGLTDVIVTIAVRTAAAEGRNVSCRKGCGACCCQPVPISASEAYAIRPLVDAMPAPRRSLVVARFSEAHSRLATAGLLEHFMHPTPVPTARQHELAMAYFNLHLLCPFLEDDSCSIHPMRPLACREYLVTSPARCCAQPTPETIRLVQLPAKISNVVRTLDRQASPNSAGWLALALALAWTEAHPEQPPSRHGQAWLEEFMALLANYESPL